MDRPLTTRQEAFLLLLAHRIVPEARDLSTDEVRRFFEIVREALGSKPAGLQRQFALFLDVVRWLPALRYGAPLDRLSPERQDAALRWFQDAPVTLVRKGFWGLKTLVFMGYYAQGEIAARFGYRPQKDAREALKAFRSPRG